MSRVGKQLVVAMAIVMLTTAAQAEPYTYVQALRRIMELDASLDVAAKRVERARQDMARVESQLGWVLSGRAGVVRETSAFGTPTDRADIGAGLDRRLKSGGTLGLTGSYVREDATTVFGPSFPNPSDSTRADVSLRQPLAKGAGNPDYTQGLEIAEAARQAAEAERAATRDNLARRVSEIFHGAVFLRARLASAEADVARSERLNEYIDANIRLGVAEAKDRLQARAQLDARRADRDTLAVAWTQQRAALNRLLERPWDATIEPVLAAVPVVPSDRARVQSEAEKNSAQVRRLQAQIRSTEAVLARARNSARDQFDFILSAGHRNLSGDTQLSGRVDNSEVVGGLQFEYRANLDDRGLQAEVSQAFIDRAIAQRELTATELDLRYQVDGLLDELSAAKVAVEQRRTHLVAEQAKVDEAVERYRRGRADTAQLIQFENDRQIAGLATDQQVVEQARRHTELEILRGTLWQHLPTPPGAP